MSPKKKRRLVILNSAIVLVNVALFAKPLLGLSLISGSALAISVGWTAIVGSVFAFARGNSQILKTRETHLLAQNIQTLNDCTAVFQEAINNGDVFDENILKNMDQIKRFTRKRNTIKEILLQKFSESEISFQKFNAVLEAVENAVYMNMRSILNKIAAFDVEEYETMQRQDFRNVDFPEEKMAIYNEYISFVDSATKTNEEILIKLDKMLLEISRYNSLEDGDAQKLPAMIELDELIQNASRYK